MRITCRSTAGAGTCRLSVKSKNMPHILQRHDLRKPWVEHSLTVCIPHLDTPELLAATVKLWQLQWSVPFILVLDTGSMLPQSDALLTTLAAQPGVEIARLQIATAMEHPSDRISIAMDYAFSRCPTECLLATHVDVFPKHRGLADKFRSLCTAATPVVGWEMSPRGAGPRGLIDGSLSDGIPGHALATFHMPTMDRIGAGWSIRRAHHVFGLPRGSTSTSGWPDTEVCLGKLLAIHGIKPVFLGRETNAEIQETDDWLHARSSTLRLLTHHKLGARSAAGFRDALARIRKWENDRERGLRSPTASVQGAESAAISQVSSNGANHSEIVAQVPFCHSRHELVVGENAYFCAHPQVNALNHIVHHELCKICSFRLKPPPVEPIPAPAFSSRSAEAKAAPTLAVVIVYLRADDSVRATLESLGTQTRQAEEVLIVHSGVLSVSSLAEPNFASGRSKPNSSIDSQANVPIDHIPMAGARLVVAGPATPDAVWRRTLEATRADLVCFLEPGDRLSHDYVQQALGIFQDPRVGIVYSDVCLAGNTKARTSAPAVCDRQLVGLRDLIHRTAVVRREALECAVPAAILRTERRGRRNPDLTSRSLRARHWERSPALDRSSWWRICRQVLALGWQAQKQSALLESTSANEPALIHSSRQLPQANFYSRAGLVDETVSLFVTLTEVRFWPALRRFLTSQAWPHQQTRLTVCGILGPSEHLAGIRDWLADSDYLDARYVSLPSVSAPVAERAAGVGRWGGPEQAETIRNDLTFRRTQAHAFNRLVRMAIDDYVWLLDEDLDPPDNVCESLLQGFDEETACVCAPFSFSARRHFIARQQGLDLLVGPGFGCTLLRGNIVRESVISAGRSIDDSFRLHAGGLKPKLDWSVRIREQVFGTEVVTV